MATDRPPLSSSEPSSLCSRCEKNGLDGVILKSLRSVNTDPESVQQVMVMDTHRAVGRYITTLSLPPKHDVGDCALCRLLHSKLGERTYYPPESWDGQTCVLVLNDSLDRLPWYSRSISILRGALNGQVAHRDLGPDLLFYITERLSEDLPALWTRKLKASAELTLLRGWINVCESSHGRCARDGPTPHDNLRISLIDCERRQVVFGSLCSRYVTLSYVWGALAMPGVDKHGFLPVELPDLLDDSIAVALGIGVKFLWVDQYCILQTDPATMHTQLSRMGDIFSHSVITIVALGKNPSIGLPGVRSSPRATSAHAKVGVVDLFSPNHKHPLNPWDQNGIQLDSPWAERGWCYQEGTLSRRIVCFTETDMQFECADGGRLESIVHFDEIGQAPWLIENKETRWFDQVNTPAIVRSTESCSIHALQREIQAYSKRKLTFQEDGLNAFYGILNAYKRAPTPLYHHWGVPFEDDEPPSKLYQSFLTNLCWTFDDEDNGAGIRRSTIPSWSWAGWNRPAPLWASWYASHQSSDLVGCFWLALIQANDEPKFVPLNWLRDRFEFSPTRFGHEIRFRAQVVAFRWVVCDNWKCWQPNRQSSPHYHPLFDCRSKNGTRFGSAHKTFASNREYVYDHDVLRKGPQGRWKLLRFGVSAAESLDTFDDQMHIIVREKLIDAAPTTASEPPQSIEDVLDNMELNSMHVPLSRNHVELFYKCERVGHMYTWKRYGIDTLDIGLEGSGRVNVPILANEDLHLLDWKSCLVELS